MKQHLVIEHAVIPALLSLWLGGCEWLSQPVVPQTAAPDTPQPSLPEWVTPPAPSKMLPVQGPTSV